MLPELSCTSSTDYEHSFIYDGETSEDICTKCGFVQIPNYKRAQKILEEQAQNRIEDFHFMNLPRTEQQQPQQSQQQQTVNIAAPVMAMAAVILENPDQLKPRRDYIIAKTTEVDFSCGGFLSTKIDGRNVDFVGKHVNSQHFNKIRYINNYIMSSTGLATYKNAIWMIASFSDKLHLPNHCKERAAEIFRKIYYQTTNIHNSKNSVCACLYYACKESKINRTMDDIARVAEEGTKYNSQIFKTLQKLVKVLDLDGTKNFPIPDEIAFLGSKLHFDENNVRVAIEMYKNVKARKRIYFTGKAPRIIASTLLYIASLINDQDINETEFCKQTNVTQYILRNRVRENLKSKHFRIWRRQIKYSRLKSI